MADLGFPRGGDANPKVEGHHPIIWPIFPENCMKMKKFWARRGGEARVPRTPLRSATGDHTNQRVLRMILSSAFIQSLPKVERLFHLIAYSRDLRIGPLKLQLCASYQRPLYLRHLAVKVMWSSNRMATKININGTLHCFGCKRCRTARSNFDYTCIFDWISTSFVKLCAHKARIHQKVLLHCFFVTLQNQGADFLLLQRKRKPQHETWYAV